MVRALAALPADCGLLPAPTWQPPGPKYLMPFSGFVGSVHTWCTRAGKIHLHKIKMSKCISLKQKNVLISRLLIKAKKTNLNLFILLFMPLLMRVTID